MCSSDLMAEIEIADAPHAGRILCQHDTWRQRARSNCKDDWTPPDHEFAFVTTRKAAIRGLVYSPWLAQRSGGQGSSATVRGLPMGAGAWASCTAAMSSSLGYWPSSQ